MSNAPVAPFDVVLTTKEYKSWFDKYSKKMKITIKEARKGFLCCSGCETMEDYKGYLMVWANYMSPCNYCWAILSEYL